MVLAGIYRLFGDDERLGLLISNAMLFLTLAFVYKIGSQVNGAVGITAAGLAFLDPINLITVNKNQADPMFTLLLAAFFASALNCFRESVRMRDVILVVKATEPVLLPEPALPSTHLTTAAFAHVNVNKIPTDVRAESKDSHPARV